MERKGIDVSQFQGYIDWPKVANGGTQFAIIRATYGTIGVDSRFKTNMENIKNTNIYRGAYHHCYANCTQSANREARHFLNIIKPYSFEYPVALDIEEPTLIPLGKDIITSIVKEFCNTVRNAGYYIIIYSSINWLQNYLNLGELSDFDIWLAQWNSQPTYTGNFGMWQYSATGNVSGISGDVDLDMSYRDYPTIISNAGLNNAGGNGSVPDNDDPNNHATCIVKPGDTLWSIAQRFLGNGDLYNKIKECNHLTENAIHVGQVLQIPIGSSEDENKSSQDPNDHIKCIVQAGDTLWSIAQRFLGNGDLYNKIKECNHLNGNIIHVGQILQIPNDSTNNPGNDSNNAPNNDSSSDSSNNSGNETNDEDDKKMVIIKYRVQPGDTLWSIAQRFLGNGDLYNIIRKVNKLPGNTIYVGQILDIPQSEESISKMIYIVKQGDTLWSIAEKLLGNSNYYNYIKAANGLTNNEIHAGQRLIIPAIKS